MKAIIQVIIIIILLPNSSFAQNPEISSIYWHLNNSVKIQTYKNGKISKTGSGYILFAKRKNIDSFDYYTITNEHVLENSDSAEVISNNNKKVKVDIILDTYHKIDISLFSFSANLDSLGYFTFKSIGKKILENYTILGDNVLTISSPIGLLNSISNGVYSANRELNGKSLLQFTAPISPGSSGGLVLNSKYLPIGVIVSQYSEGQNINFSVPLKIVLDSILNKHLSLDFGKINFDSFNVNELDKQIELAFTEVSILQDQYTKDPKQAYININKYSLVELPWQLLFIKINYELDNKLWDSFVLTLNVWIKKYGNDILSNFFLKVFTTHLTTAESFDENLIYKLEELDPQNMYSFNLFSEYLKGIYVYKNENYFSAIRIFTKLDDIRKQWDKKQNDYFFDFFQFSLLEKLILACRFQKDFKKSLLYSEEAWEIIPFITDNKMSEEYKAIFGGHLFLSYILNDNIEQSCIFYKKNLIGIENNLATKVKKGYSVFCK